MFKREHTLKDIPVSEEEVAFPIAFTLVVFKDLDQVARLLRMIYRRHNLYVIHADAKSSPLFYSGLQEVQKCFGPNVLLIPRKESVDVKWFTYTLLEAELLAMRKALEMGPWKYLINLTGQEFPLRTNSELVAALKALNGSNLVEATKKRRNEERIPHTKLPFEVR